MIFVADLQKRRIPAAKIRRLARCILRGEGAGAASLSFAFVDDREIRKLNRKFLRHDFATDVLAFRLDGDVLGEVVISTDYAAKEARKRGIPWEEELLRYVAHGTLHLLGYDDHDPRKKRIMWKRQEEYLNPGDRKLVFLRGSSRFARRS